ncbi:MAG: GNAT family N-acetyltransferase [Candidatus Thorarchaeota archaeon]
MIQIHPLTELIRARFHELSGGYSSSERYQVKKSETDDETIISLHLQPLEVPYEKRWPPDSENDARYEQIIQQGLSAGAYDDERLVGIAIAEAHLWNKTLWIWEFHIDQEYRGKGIGSQLMEHMTSVGRKAGCRVMVCETQNTNVPAIRFYRKVGFEVGGIDLSYYTNRDLTDFEVAVFMKRFIE